jgi:hypothetical protein
MGALRDKRIWMPDIIGWVHIIDRERMLDIFSGFTEREHHLPRADGLRLLRKEEGVLIHAFQS